MSSSFSSSLHALRRDGFRPAVMGVGVSGLLLGLWLVWLWRAQVPVYVTTSEARLETVGEVHPVAAPVGGRVARVAMEIGQPVRAGDVLVELESETQGLRLEEALARQAGLTSRLEALRAELDALAAEEEEEQAAMRAAREEARSLQRQADIAAQGAGQEVQRLGRLRDKGFVSEAEWSRAELEEQRHHAVSEAQRQALTRLEWEARNKASARRAQRERLKREMASDQAALASEQSRVQRLRYELEHRRIRAPLEGRLGDVSPLRVGVVVREGDVVASVVPEGELKVIADFLPSEALGRTRPGQPARVLLDAFPWVVYGTFAATVTHVASEARRGRVRVELALQPQSGPHLPREHGLTGTVEIEVERLSPARLVLRAVGEGLHGQRLGAP